MRKMLPFKVISAPAPLKRIALVLSLSFVCLAVISASAQIQLLKDVNTAEQTSYAEYRNLVHAGTHMYYTSGNDLWKSDGTTAGTVLVKRFSSISVLVMSGSTLYFAADDGSAGVELWKSDGTAAGTVMVKDIYAGTASSSPAQFTAVNGITFFSARSEKGLELWKTDGSASGTVQVKDIMGGGGSSFPSDLVDLNGTLLFVANNGQIGYELWRSDGTAAGTVPVKDIHTEYKVSSHPRHIEVVNGIAYFGAIDNTSGRELWRSDGTAAGTYRVKDIRAGGGYADIENLIEVGGTLFFTADDGIHGDELWKSDGTEAGTVLVKDMNPGAQGSNNGYPGVDDPPAMDNFTDINGILYFTAARGYTNYIYRSDGTASGTFDLGEVPWNDSPSGNLYPTPRFTYMEGNVYYFNFIEEYMYSYQNYLFKMPYNGSSPEAVRPFYTNYNFDMMEFEGNLYMFSVLEPSQGFTFIRSDGTAAGTHTVKDSGTRTVGSDIEEMITLNGYTYFRAMVGEFSSYEEVWRTDGTPEGTIKLGTSVRDYPWVAAGNHVYWVTYQNSSWELWRSAGTPASTIMLKKGVPGDWNDMMPETMINVSGRLYYSTGDGELWRSDGTAAGTRMLHDFFDIKQLYSATGRAFLVVNPDGGASTELWRADATGAYRVTYLRSNVDDIPSSHYPSANIGNILYFVTHDNTHGNELWRTNGLASGTFMVADLDDDYRGGTEPWRLEYSIFSLEVLNNELYVVADDTERDTYLWKLVGPNLLEKISPLGYSEVTKVNDGKIYIWGHDTSDFQGGQLVVSDGTSEGTQVVNRFDGSYEDFYVEVTTVGDVVYYQLISRGQLWRSDGTECGTFQVETSVPVRGWTIEGLGSSLIFSGYVEAIGAEPHVYRNINSQNPSPCGAAARTAGNEVVMSAYPNPSTDHFTLNIAGKENEVADVAVFTSSGFPVETIRGLRVNEDHQQIGATWPKGIYIVKINRGGVLSTHTIVKK